MKRVVNKLLGRKTEEAVPERKKDTSVRYGGGAGGGAVTPAPADDLLTNPANPLSPLSPLNTMFNDAAAGGAADLHRHSGCDPAPASHSTGAGHCAPDTGSTNHTTSHDTSGSYTHHHTSGFTAHHDTSSFTHSSFDGGSFSHHSF